MAPQRLAFRDGEYGTGRAILQKRTNEIREQLEKMNDELSNR